MSSQYSWRCSTFLSTRLCTTGTLRDASSTYTTGPEYTGEILTAVCIFDVVAPPMIRGSFMPRSSIFFATVTISSSDGVMRPDRPITSALCSMAASRILSGGVMTPMSTTLKLLQPSTTPTMFLPMSCTSPLTVAMRKMPACEFSPLVPLSRFSSSMYGMRCATAFFITRALLMTCGKNILPAPKRSPTVFMPSMRGPSMTCRGLAYFPQLRASSASTTANSSIPLTRAYWIRFSTLSSRHDDCCLPPAAAPAPVPFFLTAVGLHLGSSVCAYSSMRSVAFSQRLRSTSSTNSSSSLSINSYLSSITWAALTMPMSMPAAHAW
mmetsp:Transcript_656/g.1782  ORF Transcript_656/g.1782 Transcript_656/m.1782 type:complete len:323 (+) Transcript_656:1287-2255(+)